MHQAFYLLGLTIDSDNFGPARIGTLGDLTNLITPLLTTIAALIFGYMFIRVGILIMTAGSDKDKIAKAGSTATWAIVGLIVVISAYLIVKLLEIILNVDFPI